MWLARLLPPHDRSDISSALAAPACRSGCQRFLRLLKCGLLEADGASRWLPPRERGPDRRALRYVLRCVVCEHVHSCSEAHYCVTACGNFLAGSVCCSEWTMTLT